MNERFVTIALSLMLGAFFGCGEDGPDQQGVSVDGPPDTLELAIVDSIGTAFGDSNYAFGTIMSAQAAADGDIAILDMQQCRVMIYDSTGVFRTSIGGRGSGPGELLLPMDFAFLSDGRVAVSDAQAGTISIYDPDSGYVSRISGFFPIPPLFIAGGKDSSIIGLTTSMTGTEGDFAVEQQIARWTAQSSEPVSVVTSMSLQLDMSEGGARIGEGESYTFDATPGGDVLAAVVSTDRYLVEGFDSSGELFLTIDKPYQRVAKTEEEMEAGGVGISITRDSEGTTTETAQVEDVNPWRNAIQGVFADGSGRIWVRLGSVLTPTFEVYDREGILLFVAVAPNVSPDAEIVISEGGIVAFERNPEDYPRLYVLRKL